MTGTELKEKIQKEKEQFVFGSILAIATGVVASIWSNIIYDSLFKDEKIILNSPPISFLLFLTILIQAFFEFYLKDRYDDGPYTKTFWKRFFDFTLNKHWAGKIAHKINNFSIFVFKLFIWVIFIISATQSRSYVLLVLVLFFILAKEFYQKLIIIK